MKEKNIRNSLFIILGVAIVYALVRVFMGDHVIEEEVFNTRRNLFDIVLSFFYIWIPGAIALIYSKRERKPLPIFSKPSRVYWLIPLLTLVTCFVASFATLPFRDAVPMFSLFEGQSLWVRIGFGLIFFLIVYPLLTFIFSFLFLGSELYWRGYLWDRLKKMGPWKAMATIAILWGVWQIPLTAFSNLSDSSVVIRNVFATIVISFVFTPLLTFFRVMGKSVYAAALCYSSFLIAFACSIVLFQFGSMREVGIFGVWFLILTALEVLVLKLVGAKEKK